MKWPRPRFGRSLWGLGAPYPTQGTTPQQRRAMRLIWWDGILASASGAFYSEFVVLYLLALGATSTVIGLRASINSAVSLAAPLIGAWLVARTRQRKMWVLAGPGGVARLCLLLIGLVPFVVSGQAAVVLFVGLMALQSLTASVGMPAWSSLLGDLVPLRIRGRYLGSKMMFNNIAVMVTLPLAGWLVSEIGALGGFQTVWLLAAVVGFAATSMYWRVPEPEAGTSGSTESGGGMGAGFRHLRHDRRFALFCGINFAWSLGIQLAAPFFTVHMAETLGFASDTIAYLATVTTAANVLALRYAGALVDRYGAVKMTAISMLLVPLMPLMWIVGRTPLHIGLIKVYAFLAWAGFRVAATPLLLSLAPDEYRSQYVAIFSTVTGLANVLGPLPATWLYGRFGFTSNLLASAGGRLFAGLLFLWLMRSGTLTRREPDISEARPAEGR